MTLHPDRTAKSCESGSRAAILVAGGDTVPLTLVLERAGRPSNAGFTGGCFVELTDDQHEQQFQPGTIAKVKIWRSFTPVVVTSFVD